MTMVGGFIIRPAFPSFQKVLRNPDASNMQVHFSLPKALTALVKMIKAFVIIINHYYYQQY